MEILFGIAIGDNHVEKKLPQLQQQPNKPQTTTQPKNKPQKPITNELVHTKHLQQQPNKKHRKHNQLVGRRRQLVFATRETFVLGYFCCLGFEAFARAV
jgi:hypothetical protein